VTGVRGDSVRAGARFLLGEPGRSRATQRAVSREAGIAVMTKGFADGLREVHAFVAPANTPSARVCEAIGMRRDGISKDQWYKGEWLHYRAIRPVR